MSHRHSPIGCARSRTPSAIEFQCCVYLSNGFGCEERNVFREDFFKSIFIAPSSHFELNASIRNKSSTSHLHLIDFSYGECRRYRCRRRHRCSSSLPCRVEFVQRDQTETNRSIDGFLPRQLAQCVCTDICVRKFTLKS